MSAPPAGSADDPSAAAGSGPSQSETEARLRAIFETAVDGIVVIDRIGTIESFNPAAERLFGYPAADVLGCNVKMLMPEPYRSGHDGYIARYLTTGERRIIGIGREVLGQRRDGSTFPMDLAVSEMRIRGQAKFTGLVRDATERKRREEAEARFRMLVESVQDYAIVMLDLQGRVASWNLGAERIKGYRAAEILGQGIATFYPPEERVRGAAEEVLAEAARAGRAEREGWRVRKDGSRFWASVVINALHDERGQLSGFVKVTRDLTERRRAEEKLRDTQAQLIQTEKLASLGAMVAGVAHEVNTPLGVAVTATSAVQMWLDRVRRGHEGNTLTQEEFERFLSLSDEAAQAAMNNLHRAAQLVHSFKEIAVDQTSDERRSILLDVYLADALASLQPRVKKTPHKVTLDCPGQLRVDTYPGAIAQILTNLVTNSLMHAYPDGHAGKLEISVTEHGSELLLRYRDDGIGIPAANLPRIYDPFFTTRRGSGGSGLGLHIVHNLVTQRLGGRIEASSEPGHGVEFRIWLPRTAPLPASTGAGGASSTEVA